MRVVSLDELAALTTQELEAVIRDTENPIDVRRRARKRWNEIMKTPLRDQLDQTLLLTPQLTESARFDD